MSSCKCTPEICDKILAAVKAGNYRGPAAASAGVSRMSLHNWQNRAEEGIEPYASFIRDLETAEAQAEVDLIAVIRAGKPGWQAKAWVAERRYAKRWAARVRQQVTEELDAFSSRLQKRLDEATYQKVVEASKDEEHALQ